MKVHTLSLAAFGLCACASSEDSVHFPLPELGLARSMILLIDDDPSASPFVVMTDLPLEPIRIDRDFLSLEHAEIEIALYACSLQGLGLLAGQGRPQPRAADKRKLSRPAAVHRSTVEAGRVSPYVQQSPGSTADAIEALDLGLDPAQACPEIEVTRLLVELGRGRVELLAPFSAGRALLVFSDGTQSTLDEGGFVPLEGELASTRIVAAHRLSDGRSIVAGEGGRPVWMGSMESGFERVADMVGTELNQIFLAPSRDPATPLDVFALRTNAVEHFDGQQWVVTSTHVAFPDGLTRERGIVWSDREEALFVIPTDEKGAFRIREGELKHEQVVPNALNERTSFVAADNAFGTIVGVSDTSMWRKDPDSGWTPFTEALHRGHPRLAFAVGRALLFSDNQGTLHTVDAVAGQVCPEIGVASNAVGMVAPLSDGLVAVATEPFRPLPTLALLRFRNLNPDCDTNIDR